MKAWSLCYEGKESLYTRQDGLSMWGLQSLIPRLQSFVLRQQFMKPRLRNGSFCQERAGKDCFSYMAGCSGESYEHPWTCWESSVRKKVRNFNIELPVGKFRTSLELGDSCLVQSVLLSMLTSFWREWEHRNMFLNDLNVQFEEWCLVVYVGIDKSCHGSWESLVNVENSHGDSKLLPKRVRIFADMSTMICTERRFDLFLCVTLTMDSWQIVLI